MLNGAYTDAVGELPARQEQLLRLLSEHGSVSVAELARSLEAGSATIRRDLQQLGEHGLLVRTYGGAILPGSARVQVSSVEQTSWKHAIAAAAFELVDDDQTIVITSGTTTIELARRLAVSRRRLTVITNALDVAQMLLDREGIQLIVLGGVVRPRMHSLLGHLTELTARELRADTLFMGIPALSVEHGLMSEHMPEVLMDRTLRRMARDVVVLADATKFDRVAPAFVFGMEEVHTVVTDQRVRTEVLEQLAAIETGVIVAPPISEPAEGAGVHAPTVPESSSPSR